MPTPLPDDDHVLLTRPDLVESTFNARGIASAAAGAGGLTEIQSLLLEALMEAMTDHHIDIAALEPISAAEFAAGMAPRNLAFRTRGVQLMLLLAMTLRPLPEEVVDRITDFAHELSVDDGMIPVARRFASGSLGLAAVDFARNGYTATWQPADAASLHTSVEIREAWDSAVNDPALAARWDALEDLPADSLGRLVWQLYHARGFEFPGRPGSAPPLLSQHDWVHVLADYGTTVEAELEVFAFIARANDDMRAFSLLAMVVSLFETGYLRSGAGLFESDLGHLSGGPGVATRLADAMRRGAWCSDTVTGSDSIDFLRIDWFALAPLPVDEVRDRFSLRPKSDAAIEAGSAGPRQPGGISPFQLRAGVAAAQARGEEYDAYGATDADGHDGRDLDARTEPS